MTKFHPAFVHLSGNLLCAIDIETTGREPGYHEIIQIAIQPLNSQVKPNHDIPPFYRNIRPECVDRIDRHATAVHGIDIDDLIVSSPSSYHVEEALGQWFIDLDLPIDCRIAPLAHNWAFESAFLKIWLGVEQFDVFFNSVARDTMLDAMFINDQRYMSGAKIPFPNVSLYHVCRKLNVVNSNPHDALCDCLATAEVYRKLLLQGPV